MDLNFFCNFGRQDGFFSVYLKERFIPSEFSLNIPFVVDTSVCLERGKPGRIFIIDVQPQCCVLVSKLSFDTFHKASL